MTERGDSAAVAALELCLHGLCGCCARADGPPCEPCLQLHLEHDDAVKTFLEHVTSIQIRHQTLRGAHPSWDQDIAYPAHLAAAAGDTGTRDELFHVDPLTDVLHEIPIGKRWVTDRYPELGYLAVLTGSFLQLMRDRRAQLEKLHPNIPPLAWAQILDDPSIKRIAS